MSAPGILTLLVSRWTISWPLTAVCIAVAVLYVVAARQPRRWPHNRTVAFLLGLLAVWIALDAGVETFDDRLLTAHMIQHLLLIETGPALLLYGRGPQLALRVLPPSERRRLGRALVRLGKFASPPCCLILFAVLVIGWHLPVFFQAAVRHQMLHEVEHVCFLAAGLFVWWPLLGGPGPRRLGPIGQWGYVTLAMLPMTVIGAFLNRDQTLFYPVYAAPSRALGVSPLINQQQAGAIMWVAGTVLMAAVGLLSFAQALLVAERRQQARELHEVAR